MRPTLLGMIVRIVVATIVTAPSLWIAGRMIVGEKKARFSDAFWIVAMGIILESVVVTVVRSSFASLVQFAAWLYLVKHYFDTGWGNAFFISLLTVVVFIVVTVGLAMVLGVLGLTFLGAPGPSPGGFIF